MTCYDCHREINGEGIQTQRSSTHRDFETTVCLQCAVEHDDDTWIEAFKGPETCPDCGAKDLSYANIDIEDNAVFQEAWCKECDCEWIEWYHFAGYKITVVGERPECLPTPEEKAESEQIDREIKRMKE